MAFVSIHRIRRILALFCFAAVGSSFLACRSAPADSTQNRETLYIQGAKIADGIVEYAALQYQQCSHGQTPRSDVCTGDAVSVNHFRARQICETLLLGNLRWRLPAREELEAILLADQSFIPLTDPRAFPRTRAVSYWTDSPYHGSESSYWTVDFQRGRASGETIFRNAYVRCVTAARKN